MAGQPGGQHAVEHVDAAGHHVDQAQRVAQAHEVAGAVLGERFQRRLEGRQHDVAVLADRQAAHGVPVEADGHGPLGALRAEVQLDAALDDAELVEVGTPVGQERLAGAAGPERGAVDGGGDHVAGAGERRAHVEHHLDVAAQLHLDVDGALGGEVVTAAVVGGRERGALVVDLGLQREHLVAARVGEHVARPGGEAVQATELLDHLGARPQHQVVGVAQHHLGAQPVEVGRRQRPHRPPCPHRHEARRGERPSRRRHGPGAGLAVGRLDRVPERHEGSRVRSMASPKERKR